MDPVFRRQTRIALIGVVVTLVFNAILLTRLHKEWTYFAEVLGALGLSLASHIWVLKKGKGYVPLQYIGLITGMTAGYFGIQAVATHTLPYTVLLRGMDHHIVSFVTLFSIFITVAYVTTYQASRPILFSIPLGFVVIAALYIQHKQEIFFGMGVQLPILLGWVYLVLAYTMYGNVRYTQEQRALVAREYERIQLMNSQLEEAVQQLEEKEHTSKAFARSLQNHIEETAVASTDIVTAVQQMKESIHQQNTSVAQSGEYLGTMANRLQNVISSSSLMNQQAETSSSVMQDAIRQLQQTKTFVLQIESLFAEHLENTEALYENVKEVRGNVDEIQQVSGKIKILSLNASIESAKAGAAGAGFQVISEEIRKLSMLSDESLKRITDTLSHIEKRTQHTVDRILSSQNPMKQTVDATSKLRAAFDQVERTNTTVVEEAQQVHQLVQDLQESVTRITQHMNAVTELSGENHTSTLSLSDSLHVINEMVGKIASDAQRLIEP